MKQIFFTALIVLVTAGFTQARQNIDVHRYGDVPQGGNNILAGCAPSKSRADLDINNVRCPIWINGDMWWDLVGEALYEIPVGSGKHSMFSGAIWIGGKDGSNQLKVAAQTYRQSGSDFWPGPLYDVGGTISAQTCLKYDKHFKITAAEVKLFHEEFQVAGNINYPIPESIKTWPGNGDAESGHQSALLAPFYDRAGDGIYDYNDGDFPKYNLENTFDPCDKSLLLGDQTIWWVFNDLGNVHGETGSQLAIGIEIQAQAFGFSTNDEINNMTFYRYKIINRSASQLDSTYFGSWIDPDLGNYLDDFVGCDVERGLGYCYNGDNDDDGALGYGKNPPAIGVDFFEGPEADAGDSIDNDRDNVIDEAGEQIIMSKFVYYNNDFSNIGNPSNALHHYNYMRGIWKDGSPLVFGGDGYQTPGGVLCDFMFPGNSDPYGIGLGGTQANPILAPFEWTENNTDGNGLSNTPADRRFLQAAGSFTLQSGAVNYITTGVVWARTSSGGAQASVKLLKIADVKAQNLFESCFRVNDGPDAPDLSIREMDKELIFSIINPSNSNNSGEGYTEKDINIPVNPDAVFRFEGYKVYQLASPAVSITDLTNPDLARLIFQCDIKNGLSQIVNKELSGDLNAYVPEEKVLGEDNGLKHTFRISSDAFSSGSPTLINHKPYYFMAVAYAYDSVADILDCFDPPGPGLYCLPYIQSRKNATGDKVPVYSAIPHNIAPEANGLEVNSFFADGPEITRITGMGNGYLLNTDRQTLEMKQDQVNEIIFNQSNNKILRPTYERARGPVDVRIYDPVKVPAADFDLWLTDTATSTGHWVLRNNTTGKIDSSLKTLEFPYDQLFPDYGFYVSMNQVKKPGEDPLGGNGFIEGERSYANPNNPWLSGIPDLDNFPQFDWVRSGDVAPDYEKVDDAAFYEKVISGTWAPFTLVRYSSDTTNDPISPGTFYGDGAPGQSARALDSLKWYTSVDVVFTKDQSKWSRCVVFETQLLKIRSEGNQWSNLIRKHPSMNKDGSYSQVDSGFSWFPGYAIDVETGERLNIAFGEDSYMNSTNFHGETGGDMKWNPTSNVFDFINNRVIAGGRHFIYVFGRKSVHGDNSPPAPSISYPPTDTSYWGPAYDGCQHIYYNLWPLTNPILPSQARIANKVWKDCMWVTCPILTNGQNLLDNDLRVRLRMQRPYRQMATDVQNSVNNNFPYYNFNTYNLVATTNSNEVAKDALSTIRVVPNPYYAYSNYEKNQLDNRIKIVNLPNRCSVSIYTPSGTLIRKFNRDVGFNNTEGNVFPDVNTETSLDWDLKNYKGVPVASGMYIIHVQADGIGERTLKWFGVMRPIDLDTF
jgi:hypothetical protein